MSSYTTEYGRERQLTFTAQAHQLTNINVWTPDSEWVLYDVRPKQSEFTGVTIERVQVSTGKTEVIYRAVDGAHVGVVTVSPRLPLRYVFIHGPEHPDSEWHYDFHHRRGVIVTEEGRAQTLDALDITSPFTPGALRGGSHVHVFSPDGSRLSFTYNDHVMHQRDPQQDLRNVAVALPCGPVVPPCHHPREYAGSHFCVLVTRTTPNPILGSDDISRAYEEGWVGNAGYRTAKGDIQRWALAFIGDTRSLEGNTVAEVYIVDLPEKEEAYRQAGTSPLQGTEDQLPAPPAGVKQRRLTYTGKRHYPGVVTMPRHWLRASPDGSCIAFLLRDEQGIVQLWGISPQGGEPRQITSGEQDVQSAFSWSPDGRTIALVMDNSIMLCDVQSGRLRRITPRSDTAPLPDAVVFSPDGTKIVYLREVDGVSQLFMVELT
ncbi:MAG: DUF3748 domain-containing protein [Enterobacteriaceae bacterium]